MTSSGLVDQIIKRSKSIAIIIHLQSDGDTLGSAVALKEALPNSQVDIVCASEIPAIYKSIFPALKIQNKIPEDIEAIVIVDCNEKHRTGFGRQLVTISKNTPIIVIDHHSTGNLEKIAKCYIHDTEASSTAELVEKLIKDLRSPFTPKVATALLLGIYTDTGGFQHGNTSAQVFTLASQLIRRGANLGLIAQTYLSSLPKKRQKLWGKALSGLEINRFGLATTKITQKDLSDFSAGEEDLYGLANLIALASEARASLVLIENENSWRGVLRTRSHSVNVGRLARFIGGKGVQKAGGFTVTKDVFSSKISE